jgi:hypothetical protein
VSELRQRLVDPVGTWVSVKIDGQHFLECLNNVLRAVSYGPHFTCDPLFIQWLEEAAS